MHKMILQTLTITGLIVGVSSIASASPATRPLGRDVTAQTASVEQVDYYWNHRRYHHRSWDKRHRRWNYY